MLGRAGRGSVTWWEWVGSEWETLGMASGRTGNLTELEVEASHPDDDVVHLPTATSV